MKDRLGNVQLYKNILMNIAAFFVQFVISFYISPKIVADVGTAAYGYIGLANDFVSYAGIIASVFNSVAARFITKAYYEKDYLQANKYFNSLISTNFILSGILSGISIIIVPNLDKVIAIPNDLLIDVKITFAITFLSYIVTLLTLVFTTATFVSNRTDIQGIRNIIQNIIRFAFILFFLNVLSIKLYWISVAMFIATVFTAVLNIRLTKTLTPELKFDLKLSDRKYAMMLAKSGCWMALTSISTILLRGLDLTIANVLLSEYDMGILSIARTFPNNITTIIGTIAPIFTPVMIILKKKKKSAELDSKIKESINIIVTLLYVPITGFIVYSEDFYRLWQSSLSTQEIKLVTVLSTVTVLQAYFNSSTASLAQLSVVANKLKVPVFVSLFCGIASVSLDVLLIKYTTLGIYAIVLSPTIVMIVRYVVFNSFYGAYCVDKKYMHFLPTVIKTWFSIPILFLIIGGIHRLLPVNSWGTFLISVGVSAIIGYTFMVGAYQKNKLKLLLSKYLK